MFDRPDQALFRLACSFVCLFSLSDHISVFKERKEGKVRIASRRFATSTSVSTVFEHGTKQSQKGTKSNGVKTLVCRLINLSLQEKLDLLLDYGSCSVAPCSIAVNPDAAQRIESCFSIIRSFSRNFIFTPRDLGPREKIKKHCRN